MQSIQTRRPTAVQPVAADSRQRYSTNNLKRLIDGLIPCVAPHLLDLGRLCDQNINWLVHHRCKVTVDDQITSLQPPFPSPSPSKNAAFRQTTKSGEPPAQAVLQLPYPAGAFDAILCWDLFDYLVSPSAQQSLQRLSALLKPRGYLLALFNCERIAARPATRYRIVGVEQLEYEPLPHANPPRRAYENREILELFAGFDLASSCYLKNQMREILVQKKAVRSPAC